ncbi:MAG: UDP-N-acetylmuramoyl-tripeptide--D-alanyl-D-alanine ligase [Desulfobacteraceae bacterium]|nr:UDP-N-acetylmuramoyl-tripeptide--D-alanyl-D-alanine ligase [Desulfobacteraceae bacterium]MBC2756031.1 UDP-N-acetylmuramoyl-tripeptide--D-alanyl-D-alanine ligase [Desulfobacteraceae bacterium]
MDEIFWTIDEIIKATGGELLAGKGLPRFTSISIDSRNISKNDLFVAVKGQTHDGHQFIEDVIEKGVQGIVIDREKFSQAFQTGISNDVCCILVDDTIRALGDLAMFHRRRFSIPVVCITGSNGKTTTKEMTASVLGQKFNTLKTVGNLNNEFGVPLTIFRMNHSHEAAVLELGMNHPGEIRRLSEICRPDLGVITNIGEAHLEGLGSIANVMSAKGELIENIKQDGGIILNGDDTYSLRLGGTASRKVSYFGQSIYADIRAIDIAKKENTTVFTLELPNEKISVKINAPGQFMVLNALAASAVGYLTGLSATEIKTGIETFRPLKGRMDIKESRRGFFIIDDSYNANPGSMEAAIKTLVSLKGQKKGALVAGDMLELGRNAQRLHESIGQVAAQSGVNRLFLTGNYVNAVKKGAQHQGMPDQDIIIGDKTELVESLVEFLCPKDWVLVKGSRGAGMEEIVKQLEATDAPAA